MVASCVRRISTALTSGALTLILAACGGDGGTAPDPGDNGNNQPPGGRMVLENPSFSADIQTIFDNRGCSASSCHGVSEQAGLNLTSGASYGELVNVPATSEPFDRVEPNDPDNSYLVIKIEGRQSVGGRMPLSGAALDTIDINNIRNWISQGAQQN